MLLAIDTATRLAGLALFNGEVRAELAWVCGRQHSTQLLPQIEHLLELASVERGDLSAIAVAQGPGSFTGLRVGLATAQGLALALGIPIYGVCTLDILAAAHSACGLAVQAVLEAGRGRYATYRYASGQQTRDAVAIPNVDLDGLLALIEPPCLVTGDLDFKARERLLGQFGNQVRLSTPAGGLRRPAILAELGWEVHLSGDCERLNSLDPIYLAR